MSDARESFRQHHPGQQPPLQTNLALMRAGGMSATAIRRTLGLSEREAVAYGIIDSRIALGPGAGGGAADAAGPDTKGPRMIEVVDALARATGHSRAALLGPGQGRQLTRMRQLAMVLLRELCRGASLPTIGHFLQRDHTTVHYGCRRANALLREDAKLRALHAHVLATFNGDEPVPTHDGSAAH